MSVDVDTFCGTCLVRGGGHAVGCRHLRHPVSVSASDPLQTIAGTGVRAEAEILEALKQSQRGPSTAYDRAQAELKTRLNEFEIRIHTFETGTVARLDAALRRIEQLEQSQARMHSTVSKFEPIAPGSVWKPEAQSPSDFDRQLPPELEAAVKDIAAKIWATHPNNPDRPGFDANGSPLPDEGT